MALFKSVNQDLGFLKQRFNVSKIGAILTNRGFHALLFYRISNSLFKRRIPLIPLVLTRIIQIFYAIDIDFKCNIAGGVIIIHGVGLVIGQGVIIEAGVIIYHGVTLGRKRQIIDLTSDDGYPHVFADCVLGAGAKLIGKINIESNCVIGPNVVLTKNVPSNCIVKVPEPVIIQK